MWLRTIRKYIQNAVFPAFDKDALIFLCVYIDLELINAENLQYGGTIVLDVIKKS